MKKEEYNKEQKSSKSQLGQIGSYLEDTYYAGSLAEEGAQEIAREYLASTPPLAGRVYGNIVYWGTVVSAIMAIVGMVISFVSKADFVHPSYMLSSIWQEMSVSQIWQGAIGELPKGHWYLKHLATGNGITELGLALGVFIVIPAMLSSAYVMIKEKNVFFASLAIIAAFITTVSMVGLLPLPVG